MANYAYRMDGNITHARKIEIWCLKTRDDSQWENKKTKPLISGHAASHLFHYYYYDKYLKAIFIYLFFLNHKNSTMQQVVFRDSSSTAIQLSTASLCLSRTCLTRKKKDTLLLSPFSINLGEAGEPGRN